MVGIYNYEYEISGILGLKEDWWIMVKSQWKVDGKVMVY